MALPTLSRYIATKLCPQFPYYELSILSTQEMFAGINYWLLLLYNKA